MSTSRPARRLPPLASACLLLALLGLGPGVVVADVVETTDGLVLEGDVQKTEDGSWRILTAEGALVLPAERIRRIRPGEGPRTRLEHRREGLAESDVTGWYRLALDAEGEGLDDIARAAHEHVILLEPDHAASRRALGHEQVDGAWVPGDVARRQRGLVLFEGRWMLPAEVEASARTEEVPAAIDATGDDARVRDVIRTWASGEGALRHAARVALASVSREQRLRAALGTLLDPDAKVRAASARLLGELGDEAALRPLIFSAARDLDADVRREATLAAASFGHEDTSVPFVRALGSTSPRLVANAAEAIALLEDQRALGYLVKRLTSHGSSTRNFVAFLDQVSYVRDYDVEVAQASNIANPDVATILSGVILDVRVLDAGYTRTWLEPLLVDAAGRLAGRPFEGVQALLDWYEGAKDTLPDYPNARGEHAPQRRPGKVLGAQ